MNDATLAQGNQVLDLILQKRKPVEQLQELLKSGLLSDLLDANVQTINREKFREFIGLKPLVIERANRKREKRRKNAPQFRVLADAEVPARFADTLAKWRLMAADLGYAGPIAWLVPVGFHFKKHAPKAGPCHQQFQHLQDWTLQDEENEPTQRQLVFWIPRVIPESNKKTVAEQLALLAEFRQKYALSEHHLKAFGRASLLSGLMLLHHRLTQEKTPLDEQWVRTDTLGSDGEWLNLGGDGSRWLSCVRWSWIGGGRYDNLWCFPLGAESLETGELEF